MDYIINTNYFSSESISTVDTDTSSKLNHWQQTKKFLLIFFVYFVLCVKNISTSEANSTLKQNLTKTMKAESKSPTLLFLMQVSSINKTFPTKKNTIKTKTKKENSNYLTWRLLITWKTSNGTWKKQKLRKKQLWIWFVWSFSIFPPIYGQYKNTFFFLSFSKKKQKDQIVSYKKNFLIKKFWPKFSKYFWRKFKKKYFFVFLKYFCAIFYWFSK